MLNGNQSNPNPKCSTRKQKRAQREREREAREETVSVHLAKPLTGTPGSVGGQSVAVCLSSFINESVTSYYQTSFPVLGVGLYFCVFLF